VSVDCRHQSAPPGFCEACRLERIEALLVRIATILDGQARPGGWTTRDYIDRLYKWQIGQGEHPDHPSDY
jgi:hypothetical protein